MACDSHKLPGSANAAAPTRPACRRDRGLTRSRLRVIACQRRRANETSHQPGGRRRQAQPECAVPYSLRPAPGPRRRRLADAIRDARRRFNGGNLKAEPRAPRPRPCQNRPCPGPGSGQIDPVGASRGVCGWIPPVRRGLDRLGRPGISDQGRCGSVFGSRAPAAAGLGVWCSVRGAVWVPAAQAIVARGKGGAGVA